jgi:hypothetical protein
MPIISNFHKIIKYYIENRKKDLEVMISTYLFVCPDCGGIMTYYDTVNRIVKEMNVWIPISRVQCPNKCHTIRVLPDFLEPYKHYSAECIESTLKEAEYETAENIETEASVPTIRRWIKQYQELMNKWLSRLKSIAQKRNGYQVSLIIDNDKKSLIDKIMIVLELINESYKDVNTLSTSRIVIAAYDGWVFH